MDRELDLEHRKAADRHIAVGERILGELRASMNRGHTGRDCELLIATVQETVRLIRNYRPILPAALPDPPPQDE